MGIFNIKKIIELHYYSIVKNSSFPLAIFWFGLIPLFISVVGTYLHPIDQNFIQILIPVMGILIGFSINAVILLMGKSHDNSDKFLEDSTAEGKSFISSGKISELYEHTRNHTHYILILGLIILVLLCFCYLVSRSRIVPHFIKTGYFYDWSLSIFLYSLLSHYILSVFLIPSHIYAIVEAEEKYNNNRN